MPSLCVRVRFPALLVLAAALLAGCVSTEEQFNKAQSLRSNGQYEDAAYLLVRVLDRDDTYPGARRELSAVGQRAMDSLMTVARAADAAGAPIRAVDRLDAVRALSSACADVDVQVEMPDGYAAFRQEAQQHAFDTLIANARDAAAADDWAAADELYVRASGYVQSSEHRQIIDEGRADVSLRWSNALMTDGAFRAAFERASFVSNRVPPDHPLAQNAAEVQRDAVQRGTQRVACGPLDQTRRVERQLSSAFLTDLNDLLRYEYWAAPPLFVETVDPSLTWRALRRLDLRSDGLNRRNATRFGREVDADYVVFGTLTQLAPSQENVTSETHTAPLRDAEGDTTYTVRRYDLLLTATAEMTIVDARSGAIVHEAALNVDATQPVQRAVYDGNWRTLALSRSEQRLFSRQAYERVRADVEAQLQEAVAQSVAAGTYGAILDRIE